MRDGKPTPRVFTQNAPCTKLDLWNCFRGRRGYKQVQVDEAKAVIGVNAPRNMLTQRYVTQVRNQAGDLCFQLTEDGIAWLEKGFRSFLVRHPERRGEAVNVPRGW